MTQPQGGPGRAALGVAGPGRPPGGAPRDRVVVRAPAKVNLHLAAGPPGADGYHPLVTVFQALSLFEEVTASRAAPGAGVSLDVTGRGAEHTPLDASNLAVRAAHVLARHLGRPADVALSVHKAVPVAGGMAGGSADAAAALLACDLLWGGGLDREEMLGLAAALGADVPFALVGGTALGLARGDRLTPVTARGDLQWVLATSEQGLSTPEVFRALDDARAAGTAPGRGALEPRVPPDLARALDDGDARALGVALSNDLQDAAITLRPALASVIGAAHDAGALGAVVSGSGPTIAVLAEGVDHAAELTRVLGAHPGVAQARRVHGPVPGAHQVLGAGVSPHHPSLRGR